MKRFVVAGALSVLTIFVGLPAAASAAAREPQRPRVQAAERRAAVRQRGARIGRQRWRRMDADRSGTISRAEWQGRPSAFDRLDRNHDGVLSRAEFRLAMRRAVRRARM